MRSCKTASELTAIETHRHLSLRERVSLMVHRLICEPCRRYKRQMQYVDNAMSQIDAHDIPQKFTMDQQARERIRAKMNNPQDKAE